jgi:hypothetical protein
MSSSIQVISQIFFLRCKSVSSGLTSIHLPASVTVIGQRCFSRCGSLASITFESRSKFRGSEADLFAGVRLGVPEARCADAFFDN